MLMTEADQPNEGDSQQAVEQSTDTEQQTESVQEQQVSDETPVEGETSETGETKGAPDQYEFNTEVADAPNVLDPEVLTAFGEVAKDLNLPQEDAQKVLDKVAPVIQERQAKELERVRAEWASDSKSDEEFGGETFGTNLDVAKTALDTFGSDASRS